MTDKQQLELIYGSSFPGLEIFSKTDYTEEDGQAWDKWVNARYAEQQHSRQARNLHASRHRHFRASRQWISTRDGRTWREPERDETVRATLNMIGPALDYRLGVLREQRPGFRHEPLGTSVEAKEQAQAQQQVVEYYYFVLKAWLAFNDAEQAAQTDGVAFLHVYVDKSAGPEQHMELVPPTDSRFETLKAKGHAVRSSGELELPLADLSAATAGSKTTTRLAGDLRTRVVYQHETLCDPEAKTINGPYDAAKWFIISRPRDKHAARIETGDAKVDAANTEHDVEALLQFDDAAADGWTRGIPSWPENRLRQRDTVQERIVYLARSSKLPKGAWLRMVGNKVIKAVKELPGGVIPLARLTDGSSDPQFYPMPVILSWLGDQVAINALVSLLLQHVRVWGPGRLLMQRDTTLGESWNAVAGSVLTYAGMKPEGLTAPHSQNDAWRLLDFLVKKLEDKTGWNDLARGSVSGSGGMQDVSGRALLGARELFERTLGPMVRAASDGITEWAELIVRYAQYLFKTPRLIPIVGGRTDLAKKIDSSMLGTLPLVHCDPETLIPLPRALRNQMLFDLLQNNLISVAEYKQRAPFALIQDVFMGEAQQWSRAQEVNETLSERWEELDAMAEADPLQPFLPSTGIPVLWADDPQIHLAALMELILDDRKPWALRRLAMERYSVYQELYAAQNSSGEVDPTTGQPMPPSPVPLEVVGAPPQLPRAGQPNARVPSDMAPGTPSVPGALAAPESSASFLPEATQQLPIPLGEYGSVEEAYASGERMPR